MSYSLSLRLKSVSAAVLVALLGGCGTEAPQATNNTVKAPEPQPLQNYLHRPIQDDVFYFVMPDRFDNGDKSNDMGSTVHEISRGGLDPTAPKMYHGGDMKGLQDRLQYLKDMGITAIWMTPIMRNRAMQGDTAGYHGYWIVDFTEIDPHLGSNDDLKSLIDAAHALDMKVYFDIITNHTADVIKFKECHGDDGLGWIVEGTGCPYRSLEEKANGKGYTTVIPKGHENLKVPAWLNDPKHYHNQGDSMWFGENSVYGDFAGLDDLDTDSEEVTRGMINIFKDIVSEFKPDGFRIDTVKHVNIEFWQAFSPELMEHAKKEGIPQFHMFGEVYSGDPKILSRYTMEGDLPAILDFGFQSAAYQTLVEGKPSSVWQQLFDQDELYNDANSNVLDTLTFTGNHDMGRFAFFLKNKHPEMGEAEVLQRIHLSNALMFFGRGTPVIYYGDEQGFVGDGGDGDSRQDMMPSKVPSYNDDDLLGTDATTAQENFDKTHPIYQDIATLANVYQQHKALRSGVQHLRYASESDSVLAISRVIPEEAIDHLVVINMEKQSKTIEIDAEAIGYDQLAGKGEIVIKQGKLVITLPPLSYGLFKGTTTISPLLELTLGIKEHKLSEGEFPRISIAYDSPQIEALGITNMKLTTEVQTIDKQWQMVSFDEQAPYTATFSADILQNRKTLKVRTKATSPKGISMTMASELEF